MNKAKQSAVFVDRDGVINKQAAEHDYVKNWGEFEFLDNSIDGLKKLKSTEMPIFIITNQRGISRGMMSEEDLHQIHGKMQDTLKQHEADVTAIYHCPHGHDDNCDCRKPKPGMFLKAAEEHNLDLAQCFLIEDSMSGIEAGKIAGCMTILVGPKRDSHMEKAEAEGTVLPDYVAEDLSAAADIISSMR